MALDPVPWFIGGGAAHSADVARLLVHVATGGAAGIVSPGDLKVTQLPAPTDQIRVAAGAAIIPNIHAVQQSYALRAPSVTDLEITPTGSVGGRADMVVAYVEDPQFTGQPPLDVEDGPYVFVTIIEGVGSTATEVPETFDRPAIPLARINLPANTATVTDDLITNLRSVALPKRLRQTLNAPSTGTPAVGAVNALTSASYVTWPAAATWNIAVPEWATHALIRADVNSYVVKSSSTNGRLKVKLGTVLGGNVGSFDENYNATQGAYRNGIATVDTLAIPDAMRGTTQTLTLQGMRSSGTGYIDADVYTSSLVDIEFIEKAV